MIELQAKSTINAPITCSGRVPEVAGSPLPFGIAHVELSRSANPLAPFEIIETAPLCLTQTGENYPVIEDISHFVNGAWRGINAVVEQYQTLGIGLNGWRARITKLIAHETDSTERAFMLAAKNAMAACLINC